MKQVTVGFGGSCHWCTEAIFASLKGVILVEQGWFKIANQQVDYSEAIRVSYDPEQISLALLIAIHIDTHSATSNHSMRNKYRSAVYVYDEKQFNHAKLAIADKQMQYSKPLLTQVEYAGAFKSSAEQYQNYYFSDPTKPFCEVRIKPKLTKLLNDYRDNVDSTKFSLNK